MLILTPTFLQYLKKGITFGQTFHFHPFIWNEDGNGPELCGWENGLGIWYCNVITSFLYTGLLGKRLVQVRTELNEEGNPKWSLIKQVYVLFIFIYYSLALAFQVTLLLKKDELPTFFKQTVKSVKILQGKISFT